MKTTKINYSKLLLDVENREGYKDNYKFFVEQIKPEIIRSFRKALVKRIGSPSISKRTNELPSHKRKSKEAFLQLHFQELYIKVVVPVNKDFVVDDVVMVYLLQKEFTLDFKKLFIQQTEETLTIAFKTSDELGCLRVEDLWEAGNALRENVLDDFFNNAVESSQGLPNVMSILLRNDGKLPVACHVTNKVIREMFSPLFRVYEVLQSDNKSVLLQIVPYTKIDMEKW